MIAIVTRCAETQRRAAALFHDTYARARQSLTISRGAGHEKGCSDSARRRRCVHYAVIRVAVLTHMLSPEAVGKSTIVTSLIKESFVAHVRLFSSLPRKAPELAAWNQVQHIVPEVTIPPEVTPENVTTYIVDSGSTFAAMTP